MMTVNQGMSVEEIERVVAQRVANAIEAIAIYETKTNMARKSMSQTKREENKVAENASNKRKWEGNHNGSSSQQKKGHKVPRAHTTRPINKKAYARSLPLCNQCKFHHNGPCIAGDKDEACSDKEEACSDCIMSQGDLFMAGTQHGLLEPTTANSLFHPHQHYERWTVEHASEELKDIIQHLVRVVTYSHVESSLRALAGQAEGFVDKLLADFTERF
ncbi:hypothetical protein Tco_1437096 [Tanacetum coccineum]